MILIEKKKNYQLLSFFAGCLHIIFVCVIILKHGALAQLDRATAF